MAFEELLLMRIRATGDKSPTKMTECIDCDLKNLFWKHPKRCRSSSFEAAIMMSVRKKRKSVPSLQRHSRLSIFH